MEFKYDIEEVRKGHITVHIKGYSVVDIYYNAERSTSPLNKEEAEKLANELKCRLESEHPVDSLNEKDYDSKMGDFLEFLEKLCSDDDCGCGCD